MKKRNIILVIISLILLLGLALCAYYFTSSKSKIDGMSNTSSEDNYVRDEEGNIETDPISGEKYVYETYADGSPVYNDDGSRATQHEGYEQSNEEKEKESTKFSPVDINDPGETGQADPNQEPPTQNQNSSKASGDVIGEITLPN